MPHEPVPADRLEGAILDVMNARHIPGLALAVARDGQVVQTGAHGCANLEWEIPATTDTAFEIGSVSKQMTATAAMMLVEEGRVELDASLTVYLPESPPAWKPVTVRHLLTHTSGIPSYTELSGFEMTEKLSRGSFIGRLAAHPLSFDPGQRFYYNNSGYNLLGHIVASVTGQAFWDFLRARILDPLGMSSTRPRDPLDIIPKRAAGYEWVDGVFRNRDYDLTDVFSAGALVSNVGDLARWDAALGTETLVKRTTLEQMWTPHVLPSGEAVKYGFGWGIGESEGREFVSHGGSTSGFSAVMRRFLDPQLTIIVLTNIETEDAALDVAKAILPLV